MTAAQDLFLSLDLGTTACKAGAFDSHGGLLALSYVEYPLITPAAGWVEQDAEEWWRLSLRVLKDVVSQVKHLVPGGLPRALGISVQGIAFVPLGPDGQPLRNALSWLDSRAEVEARELVERFGQESFWASTGLRVHPVYTLPKILWLAKHEPETAARCRRYATAMDFLMERLAGIAVTDHSVAAGTLMHRVAALDWWEPMLREVGVDPGLLPEAAWAGTRSAAMRPELCDELGLPPGMPVVLGGHDQECAAYGAGLARGRVTISLGTASILVGSTAGPLSDPKMRIPCLPSVAEDEWVLEAPVNVGGAALRWLLDLGQNVCAAVCGAAPPCGAAADAGGAAPGVPPGLSHAHLMRLAECVPPGARGVKFFPHMTGATSPFWVPNASGVFWGLTLSVGLAEMTRAVLEGWVYQLRSNIAVFEELTGPVEELVVFGGGARSPLLTQLIADITGRIVRVPATTETALLGAAMVGALGSGAAAGLAHAQTEMVSLRAAYEPDAERHLSYADLYESYRETEDFVLSEGSD